MALKHLLKRGKNEKKRHFLSKNAAFNHCLSVVNLHFVQKIHFWVAASSGLSVF